MIVPYACDAPASAAAPAKPLSIMFFLMCAFYQVCGYGVNGNSAFLQQFSGLIPDRLPD
jgi:hypothetical protein